ncbi:efflux RND transporter periplasmic adaptor subunit [Ornithobacterium rhinotracheale]|uniref:Efflux RND transporter periplasmic adaptor subunit n=1 Tax=Ornithobacterium rhinotracheale TaxID=28251 RepID=A0A410JS39_ORNRH|nr:efflux RND transporter periplasmic adaptor subunit [Ornithobacterium rhinotracheale]QAR30965.1 efflux RND transporter periplasmic adaptor subunit [Ornithobacterium rhinotracheale]
MKAKKIIIAVLVLLVLCLGIWAFSYNYQKSTAENVVYETTHAFRTDIKKTAVATGEVKPREKIEIKPNITGVIQSIKVREGMEVSSGQLLATIKVIPNVNSLNSAQMQINSAQTELDNQTRHYNRQKWLYSQGVISKAEYETALAAYNSAKQSLKNAQNNYQTAQTGVAPGLEKYSTTQIRSTINGMVLDIPVEIGDNVQEISNFGTGTTIATIANIKDMIFEGRVDESEVGKLKIGMPLEIKIGALPDETFTGTLDFISPSGTRNNGIVEFEIKASVNLKQSDFVRAGYSANAEIITESRKNVLALPEANIQYEDDGTPFVEVKNGEQWVKKIVQLGTSDGENIEIIKGITAQDEIKVWNTSLISQKDEQNTPETK